MGNSADWPPLLHRYFLTGSQDLLTSAAKLAPSVSLRALIRAHLEQDAKTFQAHFNDAARGVENTGDIVGVVTVYLLREDFQIELLEGFQGEWGSETKKVELLQAFYHRAIALAERLPDPLPCAYYSFKLGTLLWEYGRRELAVQSYEKSADNLRRAGFARAPNDAAAALNNFAMALSALGRTSLAVQVFEEVIALRRTLPQRIDLAGTLLNAANATDRAGSPARAAELAVEGLGIFQEAGTETPELAAAYTTLSIYQSHLDDYQSARMNSARAVAIYQSLRMKGLGIDDALADALDNLVSVYLTLNLSQVAVPHVVEGLRIRRAIAKSGTPEAKRALGGTLNNAALLELAQSNQNSARSHAEEAIKIYRTLSQEELSAYGMRWVDASHVLAKILAEVGDFEGANEVIDDTLATMSSIESGGGAIDCQALARGYINLSAVLRERDELSRAQTVIKQGIDLLERNGAPGTPRLAGAYTNLGAILFSLKSWSEAAHTLRRAVAIYGDLTKLAAGAHDLNLSHALNNLGNVLHEIGDFEAARKALEEAILIRHRLSEQEPSILPEYAGALNSLGILLYEHGHLDEAENVLRRAQKIDRDLYAKQPQIFGESYAAVLNGLGRVLSYQNRLDEASKVFLEAISIHEKIGSRNGGAGVFLNLGLIETVKGHVASSVGYFEKAIAGLEERVGSRDESTNRDKFKSDFDVAYRYLIHHYAVAGESRRMRLVGALESQRRTTSLSWTRRNTRAGTAEWKILAKDLRAGSGQISAFVAQHGAVFIWIHCTDESVVLGLVGPQRMEFAAVDLSVLHALSDLDRQCRLFYRSPELGQQLTKRSFNESAKQEFQSAGRAIFAKFPLFVRRALEDPKVKVVMLSACSKSIQFPFELVADADGRYLGLVKVVARVRALSDIKGMIHPAEAVEHRAAIIGNPSHHGASNLPFSEHASTVLEGRLKQEAWQTTCLLGKGATMSAVLGLLRKRQSLGLFTYMGHGTISGGSSRLLLADGDVLCPDDLNGGLRGGPLVHLDCCFAASTVGTGGGGFEGFPFAALDAGARTVLSSFDPLDDRVAAEFSADLYEALLTHSGEKREVGQCLQQARRRSDEQYGGNPFAWSTTLLWGNPWVRL